MISKCVNPTCSKPLMRLNGGRFFGFQTRATTIEHFWLCTVCSRDFTVKFQHGKVEVVPKQKKSA